MSPQLSEWTMRQSMDTPVHILLETNRAFAFGDFRADLANLNLPTLVIGGDQDTSIPLGLTGRKTAEMIHGSRLKVVEGAGHGVYASAADRYNDALTDFLRSLD